MGANNYYSAIPNYPPYLQPTPSLGSYSRVAGSNSTNPRAKLGSIARIFNYYNAKGQGQQFINQVVFANYGVTIN